MTTIHEINKSLDKQYSFYRGRKKDHYGMIPHRYIRRTQRQDALDALSSLLTKHEPKGNICTAVCINPNGKLLVANNDGKYGYAFRVLNKLSDRTTSNNLLLELQRTSHINLTEEMHSQTTIPRNISRVIRNAINNDPNLIYSITNPKLKNFTEEVLGPINNFHKVRNYMETNGRNNELRKGIEEIVEETRIPQQAQNSRGFVMRRYDGVHAEVKIAQEIRNSADRGEYPNHLPPTPPGNQYNINLDLGIDKLSCATCWFVLEAFKDKGIELKGPGTHGKPYACANFQGIDQEVQNSAANKLLNAVVKQLQVQYVVEAQRNEISLRNNRKVGAASYSPRQESTAAQRHINLQVQKIFVCNIQESLRTHIQQSITDYMNSVPEISFNNLDFQNGNFVFPATDINNRTQELRLDLNDAKQKQTLVTLFKNLTCKQINKGLQIFQKMNTYKNSLQRPLTYLQNQNVGHLREVRTVLQTRLDHLTDSPATPVRDARDARAFRVDPRFSASPTTSPPPHAGFSNIIQDVERGNRKRALYNPNNHWTQNKKRKTFHSL